MWRYSIHIRNIADFRSYSDIVSCFTATGYIQAKGVRVDMHDLLEIGCCCPQDEMLLFLDDYQKSDIPGFEAILNKNGLLN